MVQLQQMLEPSAALVARDLDVVDLNGRDFDGMGGERPPEPEFGHGEVEEGREHGFLGAKEMGLTPFTWRTMEGDGRDRE